jgi:hypothetical protein
MSLNNLPEPEQLDRENKIMDLRRLGHTWREIAEQTGYATHVGAMKAYQRAMERYQKEPRESLQRIEVERLDSLFNAFFGKAIAELDPQAAMIAIKTIESRAKILGLNEPTRIENEVKVTDGGDLDESVRRFAYLVAEARALGHSNGEQTVLEVNSEAESDTAGIELADLVDPIGSGLGQDENGRGVDSLESPESEEDSLGGSSENGG